jgi:hypothetical protein
LGWQRQTIHESEMALLFERTQKCCRKQLDTADIVRDAIFRQPSVFVIWYPASESWLSPSFRRVPLPAKANVFHSSPFRRKNHAKFTRISASFADSHSVHRDTAGHFFSPGLQEVVHL